MANEPIIRRGYRQSEDQDAIQFRAGSGLAALDMALTRRVDLFIIGDSNAMNGGLGFNHGLSVALSNLYGLYATGLASCGENTGSGASTSPVYSTFCTGGAFTGALAALDSYMPQSANATPANLFPLDYYYQAAGTAAGAMLGAGAGYIDTTAALRGHLCWGSFASGTGNFQMQARLSYGGYTQQAIGAVISTNTGANTVNFAQLNIPALAGRGNVELRTAPAGGNVNGPFLGYYQRLEQPSRQSGISVHTLSYLGGSGLYQFAACFNALADKQLQLVLGEGRRLQLQAGQTPIIVIYVNSGLNDRNNVSQPSLGPQQDATAASAAGYVDNLQALVTRVETAYINAGWPLTELFWVIAPSHRISDPDDTQLVSYRAAAQSWAATRYRTSFVDHASLVTSAYMTANSWYASAIDQAHLSQTGYESLAALAFRPAR